MPRGLQLGKESAFMPLSEDFKSKKFMECRTKSGKITSFSF